MMVLGSGSGDGKKQLESAYSSSEAHDIDAVAEIEEGEEETIHRPVVLRKTKSLETRDEVMRKRHRYAARAVRPKSVGTKFCKPNMRWGSVPSRSTKKIKKHLVSCLLRKRKKLFVLVRRYNTQKEGKEMK